MKVKRNMEELDEYMNQAKFYYAMHSEKKTKFKKCLELIAMQIGKIKKEHNEELEELRLDLCSVDEKTKAILFGEDGAYKFSPENYKKLLSKSKELNQKQYEIHSRILPENKDHIDELSEAQKKAFNGLVIEMTDDDNFEKLFDDGISTK